MTIKLLAAAALGTLALTGMAHDADAGPARKRIFDRETIADPNCRPFNGPSGYNGNPWCDGGYKYAEDYPPGTGGYLDVFDLPQVQRLRRRYE